MDIYFSEDDEILLEIREFFKNNSITEKEKQEAKHFYCKEMHPMYGEKHTEETRKLMSISHSGEKNHMYGIRGSDNPNYGRKRPDLVQINKLRTGRIVEESTKEKLREQRIGNLNPMFGKKHKPESKEKMARFGTDNPMFGKKFKMKIMCCPHCGKSGGQGGMKRYHFNNCKTIT